MLICLIHKCLRLKWYFKLFFAFGRISLLSQLEYRLNFIAGTCVELAYMMIKLVYLVVVIQSGVNVGFLTPQMVIIFVGTYIFMTGIWMLLGGVNSMSEQVLYGGLDLLMTKPGSLQFLQTFGKFDFGLAFPNITMGIILICTGWRSAGIPATFWGIIGFIIFILSGIVLTYVFTLVPALLVFFITSVNGIYTLFAALWDFNNMPMALYNKIVKQVGTFIIPVFIITNWAGLFVLGKLSLFEIIWGFTVPIILFILTRIMWVNGIRRYTSANG